MEYGEIKFVESYINVNEFPIIENIFFLKEDTKLVPNTLYIGSSRVLSAFLKNVSTEYPLHFITFDNEVSLADFSKIGNTNILITDFGAFDCYNRINDILSEYRDWYYSLLRIQSDSGSNQRLIDVASKKMKCQSFLLSPGYSVLNSNYEVVLKNPLSEELIRNGFLSSTTVNELYNQLDDFSSESNLAYIKKEQNGSVVIVPIVHGSKTIGNVMFFSDNSETTRKIKYFFPIFLDSIRNRIIAQSNIGKYGFDVEFDCLIKDLIELRVQNQIEIDNRLELMNATLDKVYICAVIQFNDIKEVPIPISYIIGQIEKVFPKSKVTTYMDEIIIFIPRKNFDSYKFDKVGAKMFLDKHDAYLGISNSSKHLFLFNTFYLECTNAIRLGRFFSDVPNDRIFFYEDYRIMDIIDMCCKNFRTIHHHNNLIYLCHPGILWLQRHDTKNNADLKEVLYSYLMNNRNATKTSRDLHMHRNTLTYKLNKIESILGESLDDGMLQLNLMFSYLTLRYIEEYEKKDPFDIKQN